MASADNISSPQNRKNRFPQDPDAPEQQHFRQQVEAKSMEVHKPPHQLMHKKNWLEYLLEFSLVFLAVFLGFFAENTREHLIEKERALQYSRSLISDLEKDSIMLISCKRRTKVILMALDSLRKMLRGTNLAQLRGNTLYYYGRQLTNSAPFVPFDATFQQLLGSGNLRYFENHSIADDITEYYQKRIQLLTSDQGNRIRDDQIIEQQAIFFDIDQIELIKITSYDFSFQNADTLNIQAGLLDFDKFQIQQLKQTLRLRILQFQRFLERIDLTLQQGSKLRCELRDQYHL